MIGWFSTAVIGAFRSSLFRCTVVLLFHRLSAVVQFSFGTLSHGKKLPRGLPNEQFLLFVRQAKHKKREISNIIVIHRITDYHDCRLKG